MTLYVYTLVDPAFPDFVRYVGVSWNPELRRLQHIEEALRTQHRTHKCNWLRRVLAQDRFPDVQILLTCTSKREAYGMEQEAIKAFKAAGHPLTNAPEDAVQYFIQRNIRRRAAMRRSA
jgi:hypothetical protein